MSQAEPEFITIVEGPTPEFRPVADRLFYSVLEGPMEAAIALCEMRTLNGRSIVDRCRAAWREGRSVVLDFPDELRLRQQLTVISMRLEEWEQGAVLKLWVRQPVEEDEEDEADEFDEFDDGSDNFLR